MVGAMGVAGVAMASACPVPAEQRADVVERRANGLRLVGRGDQLEDLGVRERAEPPADLGEGLVRVPELRDEPEASERRVGVPGRRTLLACRRDEALGEVVADRPDRQAGEGRELVDGVLAHGLIMTVASVTVNMCRTRSGDPVAGGR